MNIWIANIGLSLLMTAVSELHAQPAAVLSIAQTRELHADLTNESVPYRQGSVVLPLPSGEVLVGHANSGRIIRISADGASVRQIGRTGRGPAEYESAERMGVLGDTVWIIDGRQSRITYLRRFGVATPITRALVQATASGIPTSTPIAVAANGRFIATANIDHRNTSSASLRAIALLSRPREGTGRTDTLARISLANFTQSLKSQGRTSGMMMLAQPFSDASRFEPSANGRFVAIVDQQDVLSHEQKSIQLLSVIGEQRYRVRLPFADAPFNASIASRLIDSQYTAATQVLRSRGSPVTIDRFQHAAGVYRPRRVVPVSGLVVGDDGAVLLRGNDWTGSTVTYAWLRPNGTLRGSLVLPSAQTIKAVRGDVVWSVHETDDGLLRLLRQTVSDG